MLTSLCDNPADIDDIRKTAVINKELLRLNVDICALQETRISDSGTLKEKDYCFFWTGKEAGAPREHGVGFAVKHKLLSTIEPAGTGNERLMALRLNSATGPVTLISAYSPTLMASGEAKDEFYDELTQLISETPHKDQLVILGDFNARVGADNGTWPIPLGHFGVGTMNENGQRLLELCTYHNLCVTNTFFATKPQHKVSWQHPRSKHWHQLDMILVRRSAINNVLITRAYQSADCDTDHSLVCCKLKLRPKKFHQSKTKGKPKIDVSKMTQPELVHQFSVSFSRRNTDMQHEASASETWKSLQTAMYNTAMDTFGKRTANSPDWFEANAYILTPLLEKKRTALADYKNFPSQHNLQILRATRKKVQQTARKCANSYWLKLSEEIERASSSGNIRGMYDGIKQALGPAQCKSAPLMSKAGEVITDKTKQLDRWVEHYSELYSTERSVTPAAIENVEALPILEQLDETPTLEELSKAIDKLSAGKAPGNDGIPPDLIKHCKSSLLQPLHELLAQCWSEGSVPQDMRDAKIITLYKNKGSRSDCNNYRGISLLNIVGKVIARVILSRLRVLAERIYPESQCGFRAQRSTIDMVFSLRQLQERCREQRMPLYVAFIDLTKAFDYVSRDGLFKLLPKTGCPPKLLSLIKSFHDNMQGTVQFNGDSSKPFSIRSGVKQGCVLAPTLFGIFFALLLKHAFGASTEGIYLRSRSDGRLFNLARLRSKTKTRKVLIRDMLFADDAAVTAHSGEDLQMMMDSFSKACKDFGLTISLNKTKVMSQDTTEEPSITIDDYTLEAVPQFTYLGSTISNNLSLDAELNMRIGKAATTFAGLTERVWSNKKLSIKTKCAVYSACILSTLLYGSEAWATYSRQEKKLNTFHMRCLRRILSVTWQDKVTNNEILQRSHLPSMFTLLRQRRLRWLGHVRRMEDGRIPKDLLYGDLANGSRPRGRPKLRFRDVVKRDMKAIKLDPNEWEELADNRTLWRGTINHLLKEGEQSLRACAEEKRRRRKEGVPTLQNIDTTLRCDRCDRACRSRIGLISHRRSCSNRAAITDI